MMKFFRKYNRHLLAVFMSLLLVIWLGQAALEDMLSPKSSNEVIGTSKYGQVTAADTERVNSQAKLLDYVSLNASRREGQVPQNLSWIRRFASLSSDPARRINGIDWVLLLREAKAFGIEVSPAKAKRRLLGTLGIEERQLQILAARQNVVVDRYYEAFADVTAIEEMLLLFQQAAGPSELMMRQAAQSALEKATVELVKIPAESFVDPDQTFTEAELTAQFEEFRDKIATAGGMDFGYYIEPVVDLQYIRIDPSKLAQSIGSDERSIEKQAFRFWQQNQSTDQRFRKPTEMLREELRKQQEATSNGVTPQPFSPYFSDFGDAREIAIEAVKTQQAQREANNIATELGRKLADPWFDIKAEKQAYKPAPEEVKNLAYYEQAVASVPLAKRYSDAIEVAFVENIDQLGLSKLAGVGSAQLELVDGRSIPLFALAFLVEGLEEIPDREGIDRTRFISQWQTQSKPLVDADGAIYLFRVTGVREGREPENVAEVRDRVAEDLRLMSAMDRAKAAADSIAAKDTGGPLSDLWGAETELQDKITPDKGGYSEPPPFARRRKIVGDGTVDVEGIGLVSAEFLDRSFELAKEGTGAKAAVVELPAQAAWVVVKGKLFTPLYEDAYLAQKDEIRRQLGSINMQRLILVDWLSNTKVRERTGFKFKSEA